MADPARSAASILSGVSQLGMGAKMLGGASKVLGTIDLFDQEVPVLGAVTDVLTVGAGIGSLIASAFDKGPEVKKEVVPKEGEVSTQFGE